MRSSKGTDDSHGHGLPYPKRVTDGKYNIPDPGIIRVAKGHCRKRFHIHFHNGKIGFRV